MESPSNHNVHASSPADASRGCKMIPETAITLIWRWAKVIYLDIVAALIKQIFA